MGGAGDRERQRQCDNDTERLDGKSEHDQRQRNEPEAAVKPGTKPLSAGEIGQALAHDQHAETDHPDAQHARKISRSHAVEVAERIVAGHPQRRGAEHDEEQARRNPFAGKRTRQ